jgi:tRNA (guanine-N7-)-methyltransferase
MLEPGAIEVELGVPIPGTILPPDQWAKTALKRLPPEGAMDWEGLFGRRAPIALDLGCGNGRFVVAHALAHPEMDHLGLDILPVVIRYATRRANQRGLTNARLAVCGGHEFLERFVAPASIAEIHVYHPQPYHDAEKVERRLIAPEFLALAHRSLVPGGRFVIQTDNPAYWRYIAAAAPRLFDFQEQVGPWPDAPEGRTRREIMARKMGLSIFRGWGEPRANLSEEEVAAIVGEMPPPRFEATRRRTPHRRSGRRGKADRRRRGGGPSGGPRGGR